MTTIEVAAQLASVVLVKGTLVAGCLIVIARLVARSASGASHLLGMGSGVLGLLFVIGPFLPSFGSGFVTVHHDVVQPLSVGPIRVSLAGTAILVWAVGALFLLGRLARDLSAARALVRQADSRSQVEEQLLARAAIAVGCERIPEVRVTSGLATAALIGFLRPVLLIPRQAQEWTEEELFGVLCHELEHARRNDWLRLMIERILTAICWVNPLVYLMTRQAAAAREAAADDAAMRAGAGATAYAGRLISVARDLRTTPRMAVSVAFASGGVDARVRALFETRDRRGVSRSSTLRAALVALPLVVTLAAVEPWTCLPGESAASEACP